MKFNFEEAPELYYLTGGAFMAFVMAVLRANRYSRKRLAVRLAEGVMCSMLTTAITIAVNSYFELPYIWSIPIGTLIGFLGTDFIHFIIVGILDFHVSRYTGRQADGSISNANAYEHESRGYEFPMHPNAVDNREDKTELNSNKGNK